MELNESLARRQARILVVDDCSRHAGSVAELLRFEGYERVETQTEAARVAALHAAHDFDLILLDLRMPDADGVAVMEELRRMRPGEMLPALIVTGYGSRKNEALAAGALDVIVKPYDPRELSLRVRNALRVRLLYREMMERAEANRAMAMHDALTGLPNRRMLLERMDNAILMARRNDRHMAALYIDLDRFKEVNDHLGHAGGDLLLQQVASRLANCVRQTDTVGRLGGDEFLMVLTEVRLPGEAAVPAAKIVRSLSEPFLIAGRHAGISASVGIAVYPEHGSTTAELLSVADAALYGMKLDGRNGFRFASEVVGGSKE
ncbi:diguanylate cyclase domain-containing protein [Noviherbaspirillum pedocola]|uniref:Diguanylate cyclase n=1 Tax=Noviherbaspirillum pedocola TaxID=2801341 RepID=A0A934W950_9BURK|nr:diguanylate cyclase [Noviherbaspirillum pedocola]MBK4737623.1 diguanylate cyclase [Noviherbaspirillum pedocola]